MVRTLLIIAGAGFVLMLVCFAGAAALGGPDLMRNGWNYTIFDDGDGHGRLERAGPRVTRTLEWDGSDRLILAAPAEVIFTQGDTASVTVEGPDNLVQRLTLSQGRLGFEGERPSGYMGIVNDSGLVVRVTAPDVSAFVIEGSGDLELRALDLDAASIEIRGSGDVSAAGRVDRLTLTIRGSGEARLEPLAVRTATVEIAGSGEAELNPTESADVAISGSGDVSLLSRPATLNTRINGSGDITVAGVEERPNESF